MKNTAIIIVLGIFLGLSSRAQNIALNKSYTFSEPANYAPTASGNELKALTDGVLSTNVFWQQKSTVGWQGKSKVVITIDLEAKKNVGALEFNTARGDNRSVFFPKNIFAFISDDKRNLNYVGDLANDAQNISGPFQIKKFALSDINQSGRYITLVVIPNGFYVFCDEIRVLQGSKTNSNTKANKLVSIDSLDQEVGALQRLAEMKANTYVNLKQVYSNKSNASKGLDQLIASPNFDINNVNAAQKNAGLYNAQALKAKYGLSYIVEQSGPWDNLNKFRNPNVTRSPLNYSFNLLLGGTQYGAFIITNTESVAKDFRFDINNENDKLLLNLFKVESVYSKNYKLVADPLVPIKTSVSIDPGVSQLVIFKLGAKVKGDVSSTISIVSGTTKNVVTINTSIKNQSSGSDLEAINWAYLNSNILKDNPGEAIKDLAAHHITTMVVPSEFIPKPGDYNFKNLITYVSTLSKFKNIVLFANYESANNWSSTNNVNFLTDQWKKLFSAWYPALLAELHKVNINNVYFYPYDEVRDHSLQNSVNFSVWAKANVPGMKIFGTFGNMKSANALIPYIDIAVIPALTGYVSNNPKNAKIWIYRTENNAKALSPYAYYRLMAWEAYLNDYAGVGFWSYSDLARGKRFNLMNDLQADWQNDYSVIYNDENGGILSSRRWESFSLGLEDYRVLKLYGNKFGISQAKAKAKEVLQNISDITKADSIRNQMIQML